ncbi:hypothetical protein GCM10008027_44710 [Pseudoalteromonas gelatinilytica]|uniref:Uncharacterized protein n=2 Tax=Pseudoalteromonas gelatinilytica TaxID=1703256 RepID=A0ABQ1UFB7_9GAMM|nr:hypothetical protein GCM10008027_44710 [Pseudoalteromonas profundi]
MATIVKNVYARYVVSKLGMPNFNVTVSQAVLYSVTLSQTRMHMRFSITTENKKDAWAYIFNKLQNDSTYLIFDDLKKEDKAKALFRSINFNDESAAKELDTWCKNYLQDKQLNSLRAALRKKSSRRNKDVLSIELDRDVYSDLNDLAAAEDMTLKDYLAMLIQDRYHEVKPPVANRSKQRKKC